MAKKFKTETNTLNMAKRVRSAFLESKNVHGDEDFQVNFEHGQWWVTCLRCVAQWSVCDAEGGDSIDGFCFEQVSDGDGCCE